MTEFSQAEMRNTEAACYALCVEYAEIVDAREWPRLAELFAEDATFTKPVPPKEVIHGSARIIAWFQSFPPDRITNHLISNFRVRMETNDTASGSCRVLLYTSEVSEPETPEGRHAAPKQLMGTYQDRYVRTKEGWRFAARVGGVTFHT
ncbi:MAG: nuclear transport factor 2 family protein [Candidatus Acidiferrales bacterium]